MNVFFFILGILSTIVIEFVILFIAVINAAVKSVKNK